MFKRRWTNAGLLLASLILAGVVVESVLRVSGLAPVSRIERWDSRTRIVRDRDTRYFERVNAMGYRGGEFGGEGRSRRVAFLGDSFVWGSGVSNDEMFSPLCEGILESETGAAWSVLPVGRPRTGTVGQRAMFDELSTKVRVDGVVVYYFVDNDPWDNLWEDAQLSGRPVPEDVRRARGEAGSGRWKGWLTRHVATYRFLRSRFGDMGTLREYPFRFLDQCRSDRVASFRDADALTRSALEAIRARALEGGGRFLGVVLIPRQEQLSESAFRAFLAIYGADPRGFDRGLPQRRVIENILVPGGFAYLDLASALEGRPPGDLFFPWDGHLNTSGHQRLAELVAAWMLPIWGRAE